MDTLATYFTNTELGCNLKIYNINSNTKKIKKILFGILYLNVKELKDKGEEINIQSIYEKGELL